MVDKCTQLGLFEGLHTTLDGRLNETSSDAFALCIFGFRMAIAQAAGGFLVNYQAMLGDEVIHFKIVRSAMRTYLGTLANTQWRQCHYLNTLPLQHAKNEVSKMREAMKNYNLYVDNSLSRDPPIADVGYSSVIPIFRGL